AQGRLPDRARQYRRSRRLARSGTHLWESAKGGLAMQFDWRACSRRGNVGASRKAGERGEESIRAEGSPRGWRIEGIDRRERKKPAGGRPATPQSPRGSTGSPAVTIHLAVVSRILAWTV